MKIFKSLAHEIVALKISRNLLEEDFNTFGSLQWYEYALSKGMVELLFVHDELVGFIETVRLNYIPQSLENIVPSDNGDIAFIANLVARNMNDILKLRKRMLAKHKDCRLLIWHSKKDKEFMIYKNLRGEHALP